jgi:hypothetical protein
MAFIVDSFRMARSANRGLLSWRIAYASFDEAIDNRCSAAIRSGKQSVWD